MAGILDNSKAALEAFLLELHTDYYPWYDRNVRWLRFWWRLAGYTQIISGFAAALLAAVATEEWFGGYGVLRTLLIALPALSAAATVAIAQSHLHERYELREEGRLAIQHLWNTGRQQFAQAATAAEYAAVHKGLLDQLNEVERRQGTGFFSVIKKDGGRAEAKVSE